MIWTRFDRRVLSPECMYPLVLGMVCAPYCKEGFGTRYSVLTVLSPVYHLVCTVGNRRCWSTLGMPNAGAGFRDKLGVFLP